MHEINHNEVEHLTVKLRMLSNGIDPATGSYLQSDTILNTTKNRKLFEEVACVLDYVLSEKRKNDKRCKLSFQVMEDEYESIPLTQEPISISKFVYNINNAIHKSGMKKLRATQITSWLVDEGYLIEQEQTEKTIKVMTAKSLEIGMSSTTITSNEEYSYEVNLYGVEAQKYILAQINQIAQKY